MSPPVIACSCCGSTLHLYQFRGQAAADCPLCMRSISTPVEPSYGEDWREAAAGWNRRCRKTARPPAPGVELSPAALRTSADDLRAQASRWLARADDLEATANGWEALLGDEDALDRALRRATAEGTERLAEELSKPSPRSAP